MSRPGGQVDNLPMPFSRRILPLVLGVCALLSWSGAQFAGGHDIARGAAPVIGIVLPAALPAASKNFQGRYEFRSRRGSRRRSRVAPPRRLPEQGNAPTLSGGTGQRGLRVTVEIPDERILVVRHGALVGVHSNTRNPDPAASIYSVREGSIDGAPRPLTEQIWSSARRALSHQSTVHGWIPVD
ncbi:MAG: hypothetical protein JWN41_989 [Thermoleophilia bacterium]|nr:hypothetical protein [Thermoleophilia bacterium]